MKTPLIMMVLLALQYLLVRRPFAATLGLALLFCFTASGHFVQTANMALMLPPWVPARVPLVYLTGVLEFVAALMILLPATRRAAGWAMPAMLVGFLPANIYAAIEYVPMGDHAWGPVYLLIRVPLQLLIVAWIWFFVLRSPAPAHAADDPVQSHRR